MFVQILPTSTIRNVLRTLRRICILILGLKGLKTRPQLLKRWIALSNFGTTGARHSEIVTNKPFCFVFYLASSPLGIGAEEEEEEPEPPEPFEYIDED